MLGPKDLRWGPPWARPSPHSPFLYQEFLTTFKGFFLHYMSSLTICVFFSFSKANFLLPQNVLTHHPRTIFLQVFFCYKCPHYIHIYERVFFASKEFPHSPSYYLFFFFIKKCHIHIQRFFFAYVLTHHMWFFFSFIKKCPHSPSQFLFFLT